MGIAIDIELTNRCNANCHFCPRDMTPHQGLMSREVFEQTLRRAVEFHDGLPPAEAEKLSVNLCGLGEPLLNKHAPDFVRQIREAGLSCGMSSNGALLDERRGDALLDAGLQRIFINASETGDDYESVYELPFEKTYRNIARFIADAKDRCEVNIVLVDHRVDKEHLKAMRQFWREAGATRFVTYDIINRGGALFVDTMQYEQYPERAKAEEMLTVDGREPLCGAPFTSQFVGYDGQYYLCCSDWRKQAPLGSVFDESFLSVAAAKLRHLRTREPVCVTCNLDPINGLTDKLRAAAAGEIEPSQVDEFVHAIVTSSAVMHASLASALGDEYHATAPPTRRLIPVRAN